MSKIHGRVSEIELDGNDLSSYSNSIEFSRSADSHDVTTFGNDAHVYAGGLTDGTVTIEGIYDDTAGSGPAAVIEPLIGKSVTLVYRPEGTGSGKPEHSVEVVVTDFTTSAPVADMVTWSVECQMSGSVTTTTQS